MVPPKKPEWFQLTDGEAHNQPNRRKRFIKIVALTAPLVIVAGGVIVAQTGESGPADAVSQTPAPVKVVSNQTSNPEPAATSNATVTPVQAKPTQTSNFVKKPAIANPPTGRGGEDEFGEHEGREHEGREHRGGDEGEWEDD